MVSKSYWQTRINRRRFQAVAAGSAVSATLLAACGGGGEEEANSDKSGLLTKVQDSSAKAVPGGIWSTFTDNDSTTLDPGVNSSAPGFENIEPVYDRLLRNGRGQNGFTGPVEPDAMESWEFSPDGTILTMKLRQNHKFDPRPPTNNRAMTTADVKWSWDRFVELSPFAANLDYNRSPTAPVESLQTPDDRTVVMKLAFPYGGLLRALAFHYSFYVMPVEAESKFDPRNEERGTGPFRLDQWTPSVGTRMSKNTDYYEKGRPFLDGIQRTILKDYSTALAQFETANIWDFAELRQEDVLRVKRDHPELIMQEKYSTGSGSYLVLSQQPDSPMRDVRIRRAVSMLIDRDAWIDVIYNADTFRQEGLPIELKWHSQIASIWEEWLDPKSSDFGEGAQYFKFNPEEARKLIAAAGYDKTLALSHFYQTNNQRYAPSNEVLNGMLSEGFTWDFKVLDYPNEWRNACQRSGGKAFNGICWNNTSAATAEIYLSSKYLPEGKYKISDDATPGLTDFARKIQREIDLQRQQEMIKDFQREAAVLMPDIKEPGLATAYQLTWPWLANFGAYTGATHPWNDYWFDASKKKA